MKKLGLHDTLETERCILRIPQESEAEEMWNLITDSTTKYMIWSKGDDFNDTLKNIIKSRKNSFEKKSWEAAIYNKQNGDFIGRCGINEIIEDIPSFQIGYWVAEEHYGEGYVPECVKAIVRFCFEKSDFQKGIITCDSRNINSGKVALKCGFEHEGTLRNHERVKGELRHTNFYGIMREQYFAQKGEK